ncbi:MAG: methyltransferase domain-containing protein [Aureispira sp.]|nr:methyltransferase domain-containing protein [Aureispira sp.]
MKWYDIFSSFYDLAIEPVYKKARKQGVEALWLKEGDLVLDLACGTGPNFKHIMPVIGESGLLIGVDYSKGMLDKARKKVKKNNWKNVVLIEQDAGKLTTSEIQEDCGKPIAVDNIICVLGLSVIPEWEAVLQNMFELLAPGGSFIIIDVYADKRVFQTWMVERIARADVSRKSWEPLEVLSKDFELSYVSKKRWLHGGLLFLAHGKKG